MPAYPQPTIESARLVLRPMVESDAPDLARLAGAKEVARTTLRIPHPYEEPAARDYITRVRGMWENDSAMVFAIVERMSNRFTGAVGLVLTPEHRRAEMGYWIGVPYWGNGYASEAAARVLRFAFEDLNLERVTACAFASNPASCRVLEKVGMTREGLLRRHLLKWGEFQDDVLFGILRDELDLGAKRPSPLT